jgi:hypothetical protein
MTNSENKENNRQRSPWATIYLIAGAFALLAVLAAGVATQTGILSSIGQHAKSLLYPGAQLVLRDSHFVEIQDERDALHPNPLMLSTIAIETVVQKKSGSGVQGCYAQFLNAGEKLINSDARQGPHAHYYSFSTGSEQRKVEFRFGIRREDVTKEAQLRLVCDGIFTPWNGISGMPDQKSF